jgi:glucose-6-phosphate 1-dehydrogenase
MHSDVDTAATVLVVLGATGDLMSRKIAPSLFYLYGKGLLPKRLWVVGFGRRPWGDPDLQDHVRRILAEKYPDAESDRVDEFVGYFRYFHGNFDQPEAFLGLGGYLQGVDDEWGVCSNKLFYLAVPPDLYPEILENIADGGLAEPCSDETGWTRILIEKPFGDDEESGRALDAMLQGLFREEQIYRIDHYLAKEMLQGIMNFRFENNLFETSWSREAIERIEIDLLEEIGIESRGAFYDAVGTLRDVGQNHLLQMLALVTMDQPLSPAADDIRRARAEAITGLLRPMTPGEVTANSFRAQYEGFREVKGVSPESRTETYFMLRTQLSGPRWAGVPVTMQSGKRVGSGSKRITVYFRHPSECMCSPGEHVTNRVIFSLEPSDQIEIVFYAKKPGFTDETEERTFRFFLYEKTEKAQYVEEYGRLLHDAFAGDQTLFVSSEEVEAGWRFIDPICDAWHDGAVPLAFYPQGSREIIEQARAAIASHARDGERSVGVVGLGKMGAGLARNLIDHNWRVVGFNRTTSVAEAMATDGLEPAITLTDLVAALPAPRAVWIMLPAGPTVDAIVFGHDDQPGLADLMCAGDVLIDGGNSHFTDDAPRAERLAERGINYLDCGTSGGPAGARSGACLMIGGDRAQFDRLEGMFADVALPGGYAYFGPSGAGHFVKMVHNGIEYGMMQAVAEGFAIMHEGMRVGEHPVAALDLAAVADVYQHGSVIESRLVGWAKEAYEEFGDDLDGVSGIVGHTGEGEWTIHVARDAGIEVPIIEGSLRFRMGTEHAPSYTGRVLTALRNAFGGHGVGPAGGPRT